MQDILQAVYVGRHAKISPAGTTITISVIVVLGRDILAWFGNLPESNRAFYEFMIQRNVQQHGDQRQKKIKMKTNNMSENKLDIF